MHHEVTFGERWDVFCALPAQPKSILDVGCGVGLGFKSYRERGARVVGVDNDAQAIDQASQHVDEALLLDIVDQPWPEHFAGSFDVVAFCDCLEHLADPWLALRRARPLLTSDGVVVASIPNVRQVRIILKLTLGRWDYVQGAGTVQRAHLRFFTRQTIVDMFEETGYEHPRFFFPRRTFHLRSPERLLNSLTFGRCADLLYGSHTVSARPRSPAFATS